MHFKNITLFLTLISATIVTTTMKVVTLPATKTVAPTVQKPPTRSKSRTGAAG